MYLNPNIHIQGDLKLVTDPATLVVSVPEIKSQLRIDTSDEDTLLSAYIEAATEMAENYCNRNFIEHEYELYFNDVRNQATLLFPDCTLLSVEAEPAEEGVPAVEAVYPVNWIDVDGAAQGSYEAYVDTYSNPSIVHTNSDFSSPTLEANASNTYWFKFKTGMGSAASDVPNAVKQAIKLIVSDMYYFREDRKRRFPMASEILLQPYKCYH